MKRFVFRLDGILRLRQHEFERERRRWLLLENERRKRGAKVEDLSARLAVGQRLLSDEVSRGSDARQISLRARGLAVGRFQVAQAEARLSEIEAPCEAARKRMLEARQKVRSLERLCERQEEEHQTESLRQEQAALDEMAVLRAARNTEDDASFMPRRESP
jgi:flagellar export protein FliJ